MSERATAAEGAQLRGTEESRRRTGGMLETAALFRSRSYRLFWIGSVFYYTGIWMDQVVRTALAYDLTGSALDLSIVAASQTLALGLFSVVGGTLADRVPKLGLMKRAQAVIVLDMALTFVLLSSGHIALWSLIILTMVFGAAIGISLPARLSFVSEVVEPGQFVRAYGFYYVAFNLLNVIGPAIGGVILAHGGSTPGFGFMTATQFVSFVMLLQIRSSRARSAGPTTSFVSDLKSMFGLVRNQRIALLMAMQAMSMAFVMSTTALLPVFAVRVYHSAVGSGVGVLRTAFGLGGLVGALVIAQAGRTRRKTRLLLATGAVQGVLLVCLAGVNRLAAGVTVLVALGLFQAVYLTLTSTLFATSVDEAMRGRVMSLYLLSTIAQPLVIIPLGGLSDQVGVQPTIFICGLLFLSLSVTLAVAFPRFRKASEATVPEQRTAPAGVAESAVP
jgi:MFS family permease